ncbi:hypothetical protein CISG_02827 [Coccidioides immitis RMSCC 3703]|uniref:Uncharacterized protein n=1 Tax=Coccidioides immitis RMSCC 3703 TaxID=454286 RepID=A0A0J8RAD3_COCIT|nr:hypothetical protein CISG_02827 [Coccidioides immitis RMSCC 3703]
MVAIPGPNAFRNQAELSHSSMRLPQSRSEGNVRSFDHSGCDSAGFSGNYFHQWYPSASYYPEQRKDLSELPDRTKVRQRSRSPVKVLEDLDEYEEIAYLSTPSRRPRSPHKKLFGENGWLGKSPTIEKQKKPGFKAFGEKIKQRVEDMTGDVMKTTSIAFQSKSSTPAISKCPISLDPPTQAKLYSEMELMICVTANKFLMDQYREGRMSAESVTKIINFWTSKNRPQVVQFQFDQATQRDLILYNIKNFAFHGECAANSVLLNATLYNWKIITKEMNVRTFCYPDSVIRKHMHDTHKILEMLGAPSPGIKETGVWVDSSIYPLRLVKRERLPVTSLPSPPSPSLTLPHSRSSNSTYGGVLASRCPFKDTCALNPELLAASRKCHHPDNAAACR